MMAFPSAVSTASSSDTSLGMQRTDLVHRMARSRVAPGDLTCFRKSAESRERTDERGACGRVSPAHKGLDLYDLAGNVPRRGDAGMVWPLHRPQTSDGW